MTNGKPNVKAAIREMSEVSGEMIEALVEQRLLAQKALDALDAGDDLRTVVESLSVGCARLRTQLAEANLDSTRARTRSVVMQACLEEGMTIKQIARLWDVSPQLVSRHTTRRSKQRV